jgi:hypothetical protein
MFKNETIKDDTKIKKENEEKKWPTIECIHLKLYGGVES